MPKPIVNRELMKNPEFQSALVRLSIWLFAAVYIGLGAVLDYYAVNLVYYWSLFVVFLVLFFGILISVLFRPVWERRRFFTLLLDVSATSFSIFLTHEAISPFYLLYIWIFISYGTRYGSRFLMAASILSVLAYSLVLAALGQWQQYTFEAVFFLLLLVVLPLYEYTLLKKLHQARREAEVSDRAKTVFLSTMSHELRTPLSGIAGMTSLLRATPLNQDQKEYVDTISSAASLLNSLIGNVLDLSKIEASRFELEAAPFEVRSLLQEVCDTLSNQALDKGLELVCRIDQQVPRVIVGDELRLKQILYNLIGNAIKFTESGEVDVAARPSAPGEKGFPNRLTIEVRDTGIGIPQQVQKHIFDSFWQADSSSTRVHGGTGLGTTIARSLARLMGGDISVESRVGEGTSFRIELPVLSSDYSEPLQFQGQTELRALVFEVNGTSQRALLDACGELGILCRPVSRIRDLAEAVGRMEETEEGLNLAIVADAPDGLEVRRLVDILRQHLGEKLPVVCVGYRGRRIEGPEAYTVFLPKPVTVGPLWRAIQAAVDGAVNEGATGRTQRTGASVELRRPVRILMAEDNAINARVLGSLLEEIGCEVFWAKDGDEALVAAAEQQFALAFIDLKMPKTDGFGFVRMQRIRERDGEHLPIIALTADLSGSLEEDCREAGMDQLLTKPIDRSQLLPIIRRYTDQVFRSS